MAQRTYICAGCGISGISGRTGKLRTLCPECAAERQRLQTRDSQARAKANGYRFVKPLACKDCGKQIPAAPPRKRRKSRCETCQATADELRATRHQRLTSDEARAKWLRTYGITPDDYNQLVEGQAGRCAVCWRVPDGPLHVDHDHTTGKVRELLCGPCNRMLGLAHEDPAVLRSAIAYLQRHNDDPRHNAADWRGPPTG